MRSLMGTAKSWLAATMKERPHPAGMVICTPSRSVSQSELTAWAVGHMARAHARNNGRHLLYVAGQTALLNQMRTAVLRAQRPHGRPGSHVVVEHNARSVSLGEFTYITPKMALRFALLFPRRVSCLVLDEYHAEEMNEMAKFVEIVKPLTTLVVTGRELPSDHPWQQFKGPLVLRGRVQPPASQPG